MPMAAGLGFVGFAQPILTARAFAEPHGESLDANRELIALGVGNIGAGLLHGFPSSSSQSRTAVADGAGMRTQLAQIGAGLMVVGFLLWFTGVLHDVPSVALAAIVIYAAASLFDPEGLTRLYRQDRSEFAAAVVTFAGVVVLGMLVGILTAVCLSLALLISRIARPRGAVIGALDGAEGFHELESSQGLEAASGVVVYRFDAPLFFANADYFVEQATEVFDQAAARRLVLDFEAIIFIDVTAVRGLQRLIAHVKSTSAELCLARTRQPVLDQLKDVGLVKEIGEDRFFQTLRSAVEGPHHFSTGEP
jgi:SulP family sulfate permease